MNPSQTILQNSPSNKTKKNINQSHSIRPNTTSSSSTFGNRNNMTNKKAPYHSQTYQQQSK